MGKVIAAITTTSVDGYIVGPKDGPEHGLSIGGERQKIRDGRIGDNPELFTYEAMAWAFEHQPLLRKAIRDLRGPEIARS